MSNEFRVSVIIPVFNAERFIKEAVSSALEQKAVKEILLVEDGSGDGSLKICHELREKWPQVRLLTHANGKNKGAGASRNLGIIESRYDYIAFLDADDYYLSNRFATTKDVFMDKPDADGVYEAIGVDFDDEGVKVAFKESGIPELTTVRNPSLSKMELFDSISGQGELHGYFSLDGLTIKKSSLSKLNGFFNPALQLHQDTEFILRLIYYCNLLPGQLEIPVAKRRIHNTNRITRILNDRQKRGYSRGKMYAALATWSGNVAIHSKYKNYFRGSKYYYMLANLSGIERLIYAMVWVLRFPEALRHEKVRYRFFREIGRQNWLVALYSRWLEYILIRFR